MRWTFFIPVIALALAGCDSDPEPTDSGVDAGSDADATLDGSNDSGEDGGGGDADADTEEGDGGPQTNIDDLVSWYGPEPDVVAWRNAVVTIQFRHQIDADTLLVEINGEPVDMLTLDDQEFRFVPLPLFDSDADYTVTIAAGVVDVVDNELDGDFSWTFHTELNDIDVNGDPELTADEVDLIMAGGADEFMDLVVDYDNPDSTLFDISPPVDPTDDTVQHLIDRMMVSVVHHGGIGLAAPQVAINRRLFVADVGDGFEAFLNPVILDLGDELDSYTEGCLSVPDLPLDVLRPTWVEFEYDDADGVHVDSRTLENPGGIFSIPARVWQHEYDHLNGILITERATAL